MKLIKINENLLVNSDRVDYIEQTNKGIIICIDRRVFPIDSKANLDEILKELYNDDNIWGKQHWNG